jgi:WD40 repeat protein
VLMLSGPPDVETIAFTADNATLLIEHGNREIGVRAWNLADRSARQLELNTLAVFSPFALHRSGRWAFARTNSSVAPDTNPARVFDLDNGTTAPFFLADWPGRLIDATATNRVASVGYKKYDTDRPVTPGGGRIYNWALTSAGPECVWSRDVPADTRVWLIACAGADRVATAEMNPGAPGWNVRVTIYGPTGEPEAVLKVPKFPPQQFLTSPDGRQLVYRPGTELHVWDTTDWKKRPIVVPGKRKSTMWPRAAAFHPSGRYLLLGYDGPSVLVYDTATWKEVRKWKWSIGALRAVAVSPDGSLAAAAGPRGNIVVWDLDL